MNLIGQSLANVISLEIQTDVKKFKLGQKYKGALLYFCLGSESQIVYGEFLRSGRRIHSSIGVIIASHIPFSRRMKNLGRRIKDFFLSWADEIRRSPGQNKTPEYHTLNE